MLQQAAPRILQARAVVPLRSAVLTQRFLAKNHKPRRPLEYKSPSHQPPSNNVQKPNSNVNIRAANESFQRQLVRDHNGESVMPSEAAEAEAVKADPFLAASNRSEFPEDSTGERVTAQRGTSRSTTQRHAVPTSRSNDELTNPIHSGSPQDAQIESQSQIPLHDLTKGIPSTLDAELEAAARKQDEAERGGPVGQQSGGGQGDKQMPASAYITSAERRRNKMMGWMFASMGLLILLGPVYLGRNWETEEEEKAHKDTPSGWGLMLFFNRVKARLTSTLDYYNEPAFEKLLPDPEPEWERPYTLVLSLENLLVHSEWSREHGWRVAKRPGVDYFIRYLNQYYELVIFTSIPSTIGAPVLMKLDPFGIVMWRLFREATRYKDGQHVKDLSFLNRDLSKVILLDTEQAHASAQPENSIILPKWKGDSDDQELVALIPFLEYVAAMGLDDTRKVLQSFEGKNIAKEFAKRERQARERFNEQLAEERRKRPRRSLGGLLGSFLGLKGGGIGNLGVGAGPDGAASASAAAAAAAGLDAPLNLVEGFEQGKMLHDQIRERGQKQYELMERAIRENGEKWLKDIAAEEEKMKEEQMKSMKTGLTSWFTGPPEEKKKA